MYEKIEETSKKFVKTDFPLNIAIEPSNHCTLNCICCAHSQMTRKKGTVSIKLYKKIIDEIASESPYSRVWLDYYGEPLLQKFNLYYLIDYAKKKGLKNVCLNSNATLLNEDMTDMLLDSGIDFISFDCDGFSSEVYEKIRVNAKRDVVYHNIEYFLERKKEYEKEILANGDKKKTPIVEVKIMEMDENKDEIDMVMSYWRKRGAWTTKRRLISWGGKIKNIKYEEQKDRYPCGHALGVMAITWEGKVVNCVMDVDAKFVCGDANTESLKDIWQRHNKNLVDLHLNRDWERLPEICKNCSDWKIIGEERYDENGIRILKNYNSKEKML